MTRYTVSPSDFAWLLDHCARCFWLKARHRFKASGDLPAVFRNIDGGMKAAIEPDALRTIGVPVREFRPGEWVESKPYEHAGAGIVIRGKVDRSFLTDDDEIGILDYKTTLPRDAKADKYSRQLHAYAYALEHPAKGDPVPVGWTGLVCFDPYAGRFRVNGTDAAITGRLVSLPIERDRAHFEKFLDRLCETLGADEPPRPRRGCATCEAIDTIARVNGALFEAVA